MKSASSSEIPRDHSSASSSSTFAPPARPYYSYKPDKDGQVKVEQAAFIELEKKDGFTLASSYCDLSPDWRNNPSLKWVKIPGAVDFIDLDTENSENEFEGRKEWLKNMERSGVDERLTNAPQGADLSQILLTISEKGEKKCYRATGYYKYHLRGLWFIYDAQPSGPTTTPDCKEIKWYRSMREHHFRRGKVAPVAAVLAASVIGGTVGFVEGANSRSRDLLARQAESKLRSMPINTLRNPLLSKLAILASHYLIPSLAVEGGVSRVLEWLDSHKESWFKRLAPAAAAVASTLVVNQLDTFRGVPHSSKIELAGAATSAGLTARALAKGPAASRYADRTFVQDDPIFEQEFKQRLRHKFELLAAMFEVDPNTLIKMQPEKLRAEVLDRYPTALEALFWDTEHDAPFDSFALTDRIVKFPFLIRPKLYQMKRAERGSTPVFMHPGKG